MRAGSGESLLSISWQSPHSAIATTQEFHPANLPANQNHCQPTNCCEPVFLPKEMKFSLHWLASCISNSDWYHQTGDTPTWSAEFSVPARSSNLTTKSKKSLLRNQTNSIYRRLFGNELHVHWTRNKWPLFGNSQDCLEYTDLSSLSFKDHIENLKRFWLGNLLCCARISF